MPRLSICIPTYNGREVLGPLLESVVCQITSDVEVIICDDASNDNTYHLALDFSEKYSFIKVFRNTINLGMDRNFTQVVAYASGDYIWFTGQDDLFGLGAINKFFSILELQPETDFIYFNYRFKNGTLSQEVDSPPLNIKEDLYLRDSESYFKTFDHVPSFLGSAVMRREFWMNTSPAVFFGTHYVQVGVWLMNLKDRATYVVADPSFMTCRIPEDSWKHKSGQMLFEIFSGHLEVYFRVYHTDRNPVPKELYERKMNEFYRTIAHKVIFFGNLGFRRTEAIDRRIKLMFGSKLLSYWFYVLPSMYIPPFLSRRLVSIYRLFKNSSLLRVPFFK